MTDRELFVVSAVGSDYAGGGSGPDLQGESIHLASAEERSCWRAGKLKDLPKWLRGLVTFEKNIPCDQKHFSTQG